MWQRHTCSKGWACRQGNSALIQTIPSIQGLPAVGWAGAEGAGVCTSLMLRSFHVAGAHAGCSQGRADLQGLRLRGVPHGLNRIPIIILLAPPCKL